MTRDSRLLRTPSRAARPIAYVPPARSMTTTNNAATATGYGQPLQKSIAASVGATPDCERRNRVSQIRASSVGVAPLTIGEAMSKARSPTRTKHSTIVPCEERRRRQLLRDAREKRLYQIGGCQPPATPSGPPLTNTLQAPRHDPSPEVGSAGISPDGWPSPQKAASLILNTAAIVRPRTADGQ
jgi:hypothetical protein